MTSERISPVWGTILLTITIFSLSLPAYAKYSGGRGVPGDPYQIATAADLIALGETPDDYHKHFKVVADIDLAPGRAGGKVFTQAVIAPEESPFTGVFDGNAHTISHLTIKGSSFLGLFGKLTSGAEVKNLGLAGASVAVSGWGANVGALVGLNYYGKVLGCYSKGSVTGGQCVGGLVGGNTGTVGSCYSTATVSGNEQTGGLVGGTFAGAITQCYSAGKVTGNSSVGGFVGYNGGTVTLCFWDTQTSGQTNSAGGTGKTTAEMYRASTFAGWDFQTTWKIQESMEYPKLKWEPNPNAIVTTLEKVSGDNQIAIVGSKLATPLTVCLKDQYGERIAGVQVAFTFVAGDGTLEPAVAMTNASGLASTTVTLGPTTGSAKVGATVGSLSVEFSVEALALPVATSLEKVSGDNQQAIAGSRLSLPLMVRVKDQYGHIMAGVQVAFTFVDGDGTLEPAVAMTNASGLASTAVTLGPTVGPDKVRATVGSLSVEFSVEALALPVATSFEKVSGDNQQAMVGSRLSSPLTVRVKDQYGHTMAGVQVAFTFVAGSGTLEPTLAATNSSGLASTDVTLGPTVGPAQVRATVGSLSVEFSLEAMAAPTPTALEKVSGDNQQAIAGSKLAAPLVVRVNDQYRQSLAGVQVVFTVTDGDGVIEPASVTTGANGLAAAELTLGMTAGLTQVRASVGNLSVDFSIEATSFAPATFSQILYEPIAEIVVPTGDNLVTRAVEEKDGYVYLLTRDGILYTYDVADLPLQQSFVSYRTPVSTRTVSNGTGLLRYGDSVYVYGDRGMTVLDVQNPRIPAVVGTSASNHRVYNLVRHDHYLVAVGRVNGDVFYMDGKAMVYSVSDPANPVLVSELSLGIAEQGWSAAVYGSTLYVGHFSASTARSVLRVVDFRDPSHLSILRTLDLTGGSAYPYHLRIVGSQLVECGPKHISLWDLTTPSNPVLLTTQPAEPRVCAQDGDNIVTNGMVFCPNGNELQTVAAFTPGGSQVDGFPYGSAVNTSFVFIAQSGRILVLNASVPVLTINHTTGGPGSFFTVTGHDFAPSIMATVVVNDHSVGTISADTSGGIRFLLSTEQADEGRYIVTATSVLSASTRFVIASGEPIHPQEGSGTILAVPSGIAYVKYCGGTGEPNDPYRIATAADLIILGDTPEDYGKHFILTADIDLYPSLPGCRVFNQAVIAPHPETGAGNWPFNKSPFKGVFDGNGHRISHLTIDGAGYLGLFGQLAAGAEIRNLEVVDVNVVGSGGYVGGLLGLTSNGSVANCHSDGMVSGNYYVGGLVGYNVGTVTCCYSTCLVDGLRWSIGGLVGYNGAYVRQSYSTVNVIGNIWTGGLVGENGGTVTECYSTGRVWGTSDVGGLVGYDYDWSQADRCFWDTQTSGRATSAGGTGKTTAQMKRASTFIDAGWDFVGETANGAEDIWWIDEGKDYPRLWWERAEP